VTIHNIDSYVRSLWDWGFLDECFGDTGISISDLDGIVERNGWILALEAKGSGKQIPRGQVRTFRVLASKGFTILVIWGEPNAPESMQVWYPHREEPQRPRPARLDDVKDIVSRWFNWANANGSVPGGLP
jgi:hypothetical protein